jgi:hypothetical protein
MTVNCTVEVLMDTIGVALKLILTMPGHLILIVLVPLR